LAVFDELSSYSFVVKDRTCRFGVSVYLSTEILQPIPAGRDVLILTKATKIGKTLGFATMEMFDADGLLLARGEHIKYLPMGPMWDFMANLVLSPMVLSFLLKYGDKLNSFKVHLFFAVDFWELDFHDEFEFHIRSLLLKIPFHVNPQPCNTVPLRATFISWIFTRC
jgi:hypothetical protein